VVPGGKFERVADNAEPLFGEVLPGARQDSVDGDAGYGGLSGAD
jgi:hypothetical protein